MAGMEFPSPEGSDDSAFDPEVVAGYTPEESHEAIDRGLREASFGLYGADDAALDHERMKMHIEETLDTQTGLKQIIGGDPTSGIVRGDEEVLDPEYLMQIGREVDEHLTSEVLRKKLDEVKRESANETESPDEGA